MRQMRISVLLGILICCVSVGVLGSLWQSSNESQHQQTAKLEVPPDALNVGTVWETSSLSLTIPLRNRESVPVEVQSISSSCNCFSIEPQSFVLGPGQEQQLELKIDLTTIQADTEYFTVAFTPYLKPTPTLEKALGPTWKVSGRVRRCIEVDHFLRFGGHSELAQPLVAQSLTFEPLVPLRSLSPQSVPSGWRITVELPQPKGKGRITVIPPSQLAVGPFEETVSFLPTLESGEKVPSVALTLQGTINPDIQSTPTAVQVGGRRLGETFTEVIELRSTTGRPLTVVESQVEGQGLTMEALEGVGQYRVRQVVLEPGAQTNRARFITESEGRRATIEVPVVYTGIASGSTGSGTGQKP